MHIGQFTVRSRDDHDEPLVELAVGHTSASWTVSSQMHV